MNGKEKIEQREKRYKHTLKDINKAERELAFLKKCITYGFDPKTKENVNQEFVDDRLSIINKKLNDISDNFYYDHTWKDFMTEVFKEAKEFLECLLEA